VILFAISTFPSSSFPSGRFIAMRRINPNWLTASRMVVFAPLALGLLCLDTQLSLALCLVVMLLAELTDALDGILARATGQVTDLGKIFDPLCDSVYHGLVWMGFVAAGWMPAYVAAIFLFRDQIVAYIRVYLAQKQFIMAARWSGKVKAVSQAIAQIAIVVMHISLPDSEISRTIQICLIGVAAAITAYSLVDYFRGGLLQRADIAVHFKTAA